MFNVYSLDFVCKFVVLWVPPVGKRLKLPANIILSIPNYSISVFVGGKQNNDKCKTLLLGNHVQRFCSFTFSTQWVFMESLIVFQVLLFLNLDYFSQYPKNLIFFPLAKAQTLIIVLCTAIMYLFIKNWYLLQLTWFDRKLSLREYPALSISNYELFNV